MLDADKSAVYYAIAFTRMLYGKMGYATCCRLHIRVDAAIIFSPAAAMLRHARHRYAMPAIVSILPLRCFMPYVCH